LELRIAGAPDLFAFFINETVHPEVFGLLELFDSVNPIALPEHSNVQVCRSHFFQVRLLNGLGARTGILFEHKSLYMQLGQRSFYRFPLTSAVDIFVKDLGLVLDAGKAAKMGLPLSAAAHQLFIAASGMGLGARDDSQVIETYRALRAK
jgi:hypothetical protein